VVRYRLSGEKGSLQRAGVDGGEWAAFELLEQSQALGIAFAAQIRVTSSLDSTFHIPDCFPMPGDVNLNQFS
jgi:hypothetical protein